MTIPSSSNGWRYLPSIELRDPVRQVCAYATQSRHMPQSEIPFAHVDCSMAGLE